MINILILMMYKTSCTILMNFTFPIKKHEPALQVGQYQITTQIESNIFKTTRYDDNSHTHNYNDADEYIMNILFENPVEEIIFNNDKIDEDELEDNNENESIIVTDLHNDLNIDEENPTI